MGQFKTSQTLVAPLTRRRKTVVNCFFRTLFWEILTVYYQFSILEMGVILCKLGLSQSLFLFSIFLNLRNNIIQIANPQALTFYVPGEKRHPQSFISWVSFKWKYLLMKSWPYSCSIIIMKEIWKMHMAACLTRY